MVVSPQVVARPLPVLFWQQLLEATILGALTVNIQGAGAGNRPNVLRLDTPHKTMPHGEFIADAELLLVS